MVGQVSHPGRQVESRIQKNPVSASDVQLEGEVFGMRFAKPHAASDAEIKGFIEGWAHAAEYLEKAGWDGIVSRMSQAHRMKHRLTQFVSAATSRSSRIPPRTIPHACNQ